MVCFLIWTDFEKFIIITNESSAVNGAIRIRVQTADKNITIILKSPTQLQFIDLHPVKWKAACL